LGRDGPG
jgi:hypothetical protein